MTYNTELPYLFPWYALVPADTAKRIAQMLISTGLRTQSGTPCVFGSSFAITSNVSDRLLRRLWVSEASHGRLVASGKFKEILWTHFNTETRRAMLGGHDAILPC